MEKAGLEFVYEMVKQLDETIQKLTIDEQNTKAKIGQDRLEELTDYWEHNLDEEEEAELKLSFDHWDRVMISTWAHMQRVHETRALAGQTLMKESNKD